MENRHTHTQKLTNGGSQGSSSSHGAGHDQVSYLPQSQETRGIVALGHLIMNQTFQLIFKHLETERRGNATFNLKWRLIS